MKPVLKYALLTSVAVILWSLVLYLTEMEKSDIGPYLNWVSYIIMLIFMYLAMNEEKQANEGFLSYGSAFKTGFFMILIVSAIVTVYTYMYFSFINPEIIQFIHDKTIMDMEEKGMNQEQIDMAMGYTDKFLQPGIMTVFAFFANIIMGTILALVVAAFVKKDTPVFDDKI